MSGKAPMSSSRMALLLALILGVPLGTYLIALHLPGFSLRSKTAEAKLNIRLLARMVVRRHEQSHEWRAAGPTPKTIPGAQPVPFPMDADWQALGFDPGPVRYQYQVSIVREGDQVKSIQCVAHGDLDEDGTQSSFSIWLNPDTRDVGQIEIDSELE